jgi:Acyl-CoA dehydrogenase, C-terminal domain
VEPAELALFERSLRRAVESDSGDALDAALVDLGWHDALAVDARTAISILFERQGFAHASSSALGDVVARALGLPASPGIGVVLPALGEWSPPGELDGDTLAVGGLASRSLLTSARALVVARQNGTHVSLLVPTADLVLRPVHGLDPELALVEVTGRGVRVDSRPALLLTPWTSSVALAQLALGHELVGTARKMLELARQHALERAQFGRTIGTFQAVRHRLAETLVAIESADAALGAAWDDGTPTAAAMAKALAGRSARTAVRHCQQVLAGIGFTVEHDFHLSLRRAFVLDELFGAPRTLTRDLGADLLATGRLPGPTPL